MKHGVLDLVYLNEIKNMNFTFIAIVFILQNTFSLVFTYLALHI